MPRGNVDPSVIGVALEMSAIQGNEALFAEYKKRFENAEIPAERARYLGALGGYSAFSNRFLYLRRAPRSLIANISSATPINEGSTFRRGDVDLGQGIGVRQDSGIFPSSARVR